MQTGARKIYSKSRCWHRHGKHKGRGIAALILNRYRNRPKRPLEPVDLKHMGRY